MAATRLTLTIWLALTGVGSSCGDSECKESADPARSYLIDTAHQLCSQDSDCVVVNTGCAELRIGLCGQVALNRASAESHAWKELEASLETCGASCVQCAALLQPACHDGACMRPD